MFIQTLLHKPLCRFFILAAGVGTVGTTMHLVNAQKKIKLLDSLDIQNKPEIPEENITPITPPQQQQASSGAASGSSSSSTEQKSPASPSTPAPSPEPSSEISSDSQGGSQQAGSTETDLVKFIQMKAKEIHDSNWVDTTNELGTIYSIITTVTQFKNAVEQYKQQLQESQNKK